MVKLEIEQKYKLVDKSKAENWLSSNAKFISEKSQTDIYLNPKHKKLLSERNKKDLFRIRLKSDGKCLLTFKRMHFDKHRHPSHAEEYETEGSSYGQMLGIFKLLDFSIVAEVVKNRKTYKWGEFDILIDTVKDLGSFLEIEYNGVSKDFNEVNEQINSIRLSVGVNTGDVQKRAYPILLLRKNHKTK